MSENGIVVGALTTVVFAAIAVAFVCVQAEKIVTRTKAASDVVNYARKKK